MPERTHSPSSDTGSYISQGLRTPCSHRMERERERERGVGREEVRVIQIESVEEREDRNIKGRGRKKEK